MTVENRYTNKVVFCVGAGRCGTKFLTSLFEKEKNISSSHERNAINDTFHRYCKWNNLPIDDEGFLETKKREIDVDLMNHQLSFEGSPFLSLSIAELKRRFNSKFIYLLRNPESSVRSMSSKGWYEGETYHNDINLIRGFQPELKIHHYFARILPRSLEMSDWDKLTQIGKISWYWDAMNTAIYKQIKKMDKKDYIISSIDNISYTIYGEISKWLGIKSELKEKTFNKILKTKETYSKKPSYGREWTDQEKLEFETNIKTFYKIFNIENTIQNIF